MHGKKLTCEPRGVWCHHLPTYTFKQLVSQIFLRLLLQYNIIMILQNLYVKKYSCKTDSHLYEYIEQLEQKLESASPTGWTFKTVTRGL